MAVEVQASKDLAAMAEKLRRLPRELQAADEQAVAGELESLKPAVRRSAISVLPHQGHLNLLVANSDLSVVRSGRTVTLRARNRANIRRMNDKGILRHPVWARRERPRSSWRWVDQRVQPKWFDTPTLSSEVKLRRAVERSRQRIIDRMR